MGIIYLINKGVNAMAQSKRQRTFLWYTAMGIGAYIVYQWWNQPSAQSMLPEPNIQADTRVPTMEEMGL